MALLQREVFPYYRDCVKRLTEQYDIMKSMYGVNDVVELCRMRGYVSAEQVGCLREIGVGVCSPADLSVFDEDLGFITRNGNFLLDSRYVIPIYGVNGDLVSLVGYYADQRKYITLPSPFFSKDLMFFNFNQAYKLSWQEYGGFVILVEGIFDCLSLRALGLPSIATMGATVSGIKGELLKVFKHVLAVPDDDKVGRRALNRYSKYGWQVPDNTTMLKFHGGELDFGGTVLYCKDMDNYVSWYEADDVRESLLRFAFSRNDVEELSLCW